MFWDGAFNSLAMVLITLTICDLMYSDFGRSVYFSYLVASGGGCRVNGVLRAIVHTSMSSQLYVVTSLDSGHSHLPSIMNGKCFPCVA